MRRLNVRSAQIDECIRSSMFALHGRPTNPELQPGELLLLQLVKRDAVRQEKIHSRIEFALVFDRLERDHDGAISRARWPLEGRTWNWILYGLMTVPTIPFSLEDLELSADYDGQDNARRINSSDEDRVRPLVQWSLAQVPKPDLQIVSPSRVSDVFDRRRVLQTIFNHDRMTNIGREAQAREIAEPGVPYVLGSAESSEPFQTFLVEETRFRRNPALAETLKSYYRYRCQVCGHDFEPRYGAEMAESHHVQYLSRGGLDISRNIVVLCPNHHRIIHATDARFNEHELSYEYPNGLHERLILPDHFERRTPASW